MYRLLLVDDHQVFLNLMKKYLEENGYSVDVAPSGERAIQLVTEKGDEYAMVILDFVMGGRNGAETAREMLRIRPDLYILIYSSDASRDALKESWKAGAVEFIDKSGSHEDLLAAIRRWCLKYRETRLTLPPTPETENSKLIRSLGLVGVSNRMAKVAELAHKYRETNSTLLLLGESGTGKEKVAEFLHGKTNRLPFLAVNCAVYNDRADLLESELFGVEKGSFTGAVADKKGILETAAGGTVFLDEVHTLSLSAQQKLLRVLQEKKVRRVGGTREYAVDFRLIAAAKSDLEERMKRGDFLPDLYFRLNVLRIEIPALRERPEDIAPLVTHFLVLNTPPGTAPKQFLMRTLRYLERYSWPGNVRELEHTIERLCITVKDSSVITPEDLDAKFYEEKPAESVYRREPRDLSKEVVVAAIQASRTIRDAAERLGIPKSTLHDLAKRYGVQTARGRERAG